MRYARFLLLGLLALAVLVLQARHPPPASSVVDTDGDGYDDALENYLGTDPFDDCPGPPSWTDAWPPDIAVDGLVNVLDLLGYKPGLGLTYRDPEWYSAVQRTDLSGDGAISMVADAWHHLAPVFNTFCDGGPQPPPVLVDDDPVTMGIDPEITGNSASNLGDLEACVRVDVAPGDLGDGVADHEIDVYVAGDTDAPTAYDAWVTYDPEAVDPIDPQSWDSPKLSDPSCTIRINLITKRTFRVIGAEMCLQGNGTPGDGTILRMELDAVSAGPACFGFGFINAYASEGRTHPTFLDAAMLAINEDCPTDDWDTDGVFDVCDNCPYWPNPAQNWPPWAVPAGDPDCDGFPSTVAVGVYGAETDIGTDPADACPDTPDPNDEDPDPWPPDWDDSQTVNLLDLLPFKPHFNATYPDPLYDPRYDLNTDDAINLLDMLPFKPFFNLSCTP